MQVVLVGGLQYHRAVASSDGSGQCEGDCRMLLSGVMAGERCWLAQEATQSAWA